MVELIRIISLIWTSKSLTPREFIECRFERKFCSRFFAVLRGVAFGLTTWQVSSGWNWKNYLEMAANDNVGNGRVVQKHKGVFLAIKRLPKVPGIWEILYKCATRITYFWRTRWAKAKKGSTPENVTGRRKKDFTKFAPQGKYDAMKVQFRVRSTWGENIMNATFAF